MELKFRVDLFRKIQDLIFKSKKMAFAFLYITDNSGVDFQGFPHICIAHPFCT